MSLIPALVVAVALTAQAALPGQNDVGKTGVAAPHYIFFDFGRPVLSRDAEAVLGDVVKVAQANPGARIDVVGFSDAAGPAWANASISRKRAEVVRDYLVSKGLSGSSMRIAARGEQSLLVPTADGVREPQNRRVEVRFAR